MRSSALYLSLIFLCGQMAGVSGGRAISLEKTENLLETENETARALLKSSVIHVFEPTKEFLEFRKRNNRFADVVKTSSLDFLRTPGGSPEGFIEANSRKDSYKKPAHSPLSFVVFLKLRTREDVFAIRYLRLHDRRFEIEVDQISPKAAAETEVPLLAILEVPLAPLDPGSFFYSVSFNKGIHREDFNGLPEGWEFSDADRHFSSSSGCTIVDLQNAPTKVLEGPVRQSGDFTEGQIEQVLEKLRRVEFPAARDVVYKAAGLAKGAKERLATFGSSKTNFTTTHILTSEEDGYRLLLRSKPGGISGFPAVIESATLYRRENEQRLILFDSRIAREY